MKKDKRKPGLSQEELAAVIKQLEDRNGRLTPKKLLAVAKNPRHVLHRYFEWDDTKAASAYRLRQAAKLLTRVSVVLEIQEQIVTTVGYTHDPKLPPNTQGYVSVEQLRKEPENAELMIIAELERVDQCLSRAEALAEAVKLTDLIVPIRKRVNRTKNRIQANMSAAPPA